MKYILPAAIAIGTGIVILLSYLIPVPDLLAARALLTDWAVTLAGLAVLLGVLNVVMANFRRMQSREKGWGYNLLTVLAAVAMLALGVWESFGREPALYASATLTGALFDGVIVASQAALASLVMFFLVAAAMRMPRSKPDGWTLFFLAVVAFTLVAWIPLQALRPLLAVRDWLLSVPATAGARGILLGVALGTVVFGLRVLTGAERPYKD